MCVLLETLSHLKSALTYCSCVLVDVVVAQSSLTPDCLSWVNCLVRADWGGADDADGGHGGHDAAVAVCP